MTVLIVFAIICALVGLIGSIVPGLPGPPISWIGILLVYLSSQNSAEPMTLTLMFVWLAVTVVVTVLDYVVPAWFTKVTGGNKGASIGAIVGLFAGMFIPPIGMIVGSLLGAFLGDYLVQDRGVWASFKASIGAFLGFICGTGMKLIVSGMMAYYIFKFAF